VAEVESRRFAAEITDADGRVLGEARVWAAGKRDGEWSGWLHLRDLPQPLPPGRYRLTAAEGWTGTFEVRERPTTRVFETELLPITGVGALPWPPPDDAAPIRPPPKLGTPWQGARGLPSAAPLPDGGPPRPPPGRIGPRRNRSGGRPADTG
jgi:hypothetical protein